MTLPILRIVAKKLHACFFMLLLNLRSFSPSFCDVPQPASVRVNKSCSKGSKAERGNGHNEKKRVKIQQRLVDTQEAVADKAAGVPLGRMKDKNGENNLRCQVHCSHNNHAVFASVLYFHTCSTIKRKELFLVLAAFEAFRSHLVGGSWMGLSRINPKFMDFGHL